LRKWEKQNANQRSGKGDAEERPLRIQHVVIATHEHRRAVH